MITIELNEELNGIEIYFGEKPEQNVIDQLKLNGFRFTRFKKCWWSKQTEKAIHFANSLAGQEVKPAPKAKKNSGFCLWDATQWVPFEVNTKQQAKDIAKEIKRHLSKRFPMIKFSVTTEPGITESINIRIKQGPYEKDSVYLNHVHGYAQSLLNHYQVCHDPGDIYSDYPASYNFYDYTEIDWEYKKIETTEEIEDDMKLFDEKEKKHQEKQQEAERIKREANYQKHLEEQGKIEAEYMKQEEERKKKTEFIKNNAQVMDFEEDAQYFIKDVQFAGLDKNDVLHVYETEVSKGAFSYKDVRIIKDIHFNCETAFDYFSNMLTYDYEFLKGAGGDYTEDKRISSPIDFELMSPAERKTVKWITCGAGIYLNGELMFVVDTQGHSYVRSVGLIGPETKIIQQLVTPQHLRGEELNALRKEAQLIIDTSFEVIASLNISESWEYTDFPKYKEVMKAELKKRGISLTKDVIQQVDIERLKQVLYRLFNDLGSVKDQFNDAPLVKGNKYTLFYMSDFGGLVSSKVVYDSHQPEKYAQYDNAVKMVYKPYRKRGLYRQYFYSRLLVFEGWHDLPESVLFDLDNTNGWPTKSSKFLSCDLGQFEEVLNYFKDSLNLAPIINTYSANI